MGKNFNMSMLKTGEAFEKSRGSAEKDHKPQMGKFLCSPTQGFAAFPMLDCLRPLSSCVRWLQSPRERTPDTIDLEGYLAAYVP